MVQLQTFWLLQKIKQIQKQTRKHLYEIPHMQGGESLDLVPVTLSERHEMDNDQYRLQELAQGKTNNNMSYAGSQYNFFRTIWRDIAPNLVLNRFPARLPVVILVPLSQVHGTTVFLWPRHTLSIIVGLKDEPTALLSRW